MSKLKNKLKKEKWDFTEQYFSLLFREWQNWEQNYLPINVEEKTILDIGAGEGETAYFYLQNNAKKVVCIEANPDAFSMLVKNALNHQQIEALNEPFKKAHLKIPHDLMKMDIEGYEDKLLTTTPPKPSIIEVHGLQLRDKFAQKGYIIIYQNNQPTCQYQASDICYAYWKNATAT
jgi:tRNA G37 N-methylase Trm5